MQNQSSLPVLQLQVIPSSFCPSGTFADLLNQYQNQFLSTATIDIPGLGDVTPQKIAEIDATLIALQNEIDANNKAYRQGSLTFTSGDQNQAIVFATAMPNSAYDIGINFQDTGGAATAAFAWAVVGGTQSELGFTLRTYDIPASITSGSYWVRAR